MWNNLWYTRGETNSPKTEDDKNTNTELTKIFSGEELTENAQLTFSYLTLSAWSVFHKNLIYISCPETEFWKLYFQLVHVTDQVSRQIIIKILHNQVEETIWFENSVIYVPFQKITIPMAKLKIQYCNGQVNMVQWKSMFKFLAIKSQTSKVIYLDPTI